MIKSVVLTLLVNISSIKRTHRTVDTSSKTARADEVTYQTLVCHPRLLEGWGTNPWRGRVYKTNTRGQHRQSTP